MKTYCYQNLSSFQTGTINTLNAMQLYDTTFGRYPFMNENTAMYSLDGAVVWNIKLPPLL